MSGFVISCGGTGGHLSPGIALAESLNAAGHESHLLISRKDVDSRLVSGYPQLDFIRSPGSGFSWKPIQFIKFNVQQLRALVFAVRLLSEKKPDAVIGFGGFLTVGVVFAGFVKGCPVILHEANRKPGRAIRLMSGFARRIYLPSGVSLRSLPPKTVRHLGYPVRKEIRPLSRDEARKRLGIDITGKLLLVLGGSQGALALNRWVKENFEKLADQGISVLCVTGLMKESRGQLERVSQDGHTAKAYFMPFTNQMAEVLSSADLVVSRAGAGSIAEFMRCRLPSILVPYPHATDNHQSANAQFVEQQGGAVVVAQEKLPQLIDEVTETIFNDFLLNELRSNLQRMDRDNSADYIVSDLESILAEAKEVE
ncbi:UDP-N-acetylglucosamine--N-acetylmuramyl-(pentapeptide) pyrophosphoryl-undecaprenol N-acetylglucosamine transferase [Rubellicoccus peritrichatus]|uniref:UDP-N-acetylglucosamine--N-acetylmuramyl-(pentapeptide) pyrophosphoryl-undecaprenol N-acetylglucosamine transferase n=1 Tax=Rubellicoccus peritrichatus TaxID=3080537 RepID=A0AAQ3QTC1_9BACT|nr:UDP-N-acetylglucosamine--N-acetylmuramyl-(pentapeptide) pyrophosphoryl-undecaprenol N-acetylglucosamine transferase [Puniceicoccus sp. CR14]WOO43553.1 UDP-N-acetylglucosamine--N-acetylmuramyl-(pentapeptide) pyrophosphoryl-undecaprenol N-acetylglucosamine transferase [Puniceicoccus sp. CR14]